MNCNEAVSRQDLISYRCSCGDVSEGERVLRQRSVQHDLKALTNQTSFMNLR